MNRPSSLFDALGDIVAVWRSQCAGGCLCVEEEHHARVCIIDPRPDSRSNMRIMCIRPRHFRKVAVLLVGILLVSISQLQLLTNKQQNQPINLSKRVTKSVPQPYSRGWIPNKALAKGITIDMQNQSRLIIVGDVHGCIDELHRVLELARYSSSSGDQVVFVGDMINKGPDSIGVIRLLQKEGWQAVLGNHEAMLLTLIMHLEDPNSVRQVPRNDNSIGDVLLRRLQIKCTDVSRWLKPMCSQQMRHIIQSLTLQDIEWMRTLPSYIRVPSVDGATPDLVVVHAGLLPGTSLATHTAHVMNTIRNILPDGSPSNDRMYEPSVGLPWASAWYGPEHVVFGHDSRRKLQLHKSATGIDTGCVYGGNLTALAVPGFERYSVAASKTYYST